MKKLSYTLFLLFFFANISAAQNEKIVSLVVIGEGNNTENALSNALRSAIEQTFGSFISSNTEILNDRMLSDQIISISSGNIKSYEILNKNELPLGRIGLTVKAIVSLDKLINFSESKGISIQFKGALFALNIKQQILNENSEIKAICNTIAALHQPMQTAFDYRIENGEPKSKYGNNDNWIVPSKVIVTANNNFDQCASFLINSLASISLSHEDVDSYKRLNKPVYIIKISHPNYYSGFFKSYYLRQRKSLEIINYFINNFYYYISLFDVKINFDDSSELIEQSKYNNFLNYDLNKIDLIQDNEITLSYKKNNEEVYAFQWDSEYSLAKISKITNYSVTPKGIRSLFNMSVCSY